MKLSDVTKKILCNSGWYEERRVDATKSINHLINAGYEVDEYATDFMERFGGLVLEIPNKAYSERKIVINFDAIEAEKGIDPDTVKSYEEELDEKLVVVGEGSKGVNGYIMISNLGRLFLGFDVGDLSLIGENLADALENLCNR